LLVVVSDILDFTKLEGTKFTLERTQFPLCEKIEESLGIVVIEAQRKEITLISDIDMHLPSLITGDEGRLKQVLGNLLNNAVKFSPPNATIVVTANIKDKDAENMDIIFCVEDHGIGIPESAKPKIFQPFMQADNSVARRYGGSGLGLAVCKRIVENMGGAIWFVSEEGKGSSFYFTVPVKKSECLWQSTPQQELKLLKGKTVLIIDSNPRFLEVFQKMLKYWEVNSICCKSISEAFQFQGAADLILVDWKQNQEQISELKKSTKPVTLMVESNEAFKYSCIVLKKPVRQDSLFNILINKLNQNQVQLSPPSPPTTSSFVTNQNRILVAEDNPMNQKIIQRLLNNLGYIQVDITENGVQCIEAMKKQALSPYDLIIMDVMMPEMGGIEATERLRTEMHESIPIIGLTADVCPENRQNCLKAGMNCILSKPIKANELKSILNQYLSK